MDLDIIENIDVSDPVAIQDLLDAFQEIESIDLLINVAGILQIESIEDMNFNTIFEQLDVNALGPLRVTMALLPKLKMNSKVAMITSRMGSIEDNTSGGRYGYRMSKAALNAASKSLAHDLKSQGIAVGIYHPGFVQTEMTDFNCNAIGVDQACRMLMERINELDIDNSGTFLHANGDVLPW